MSTPESGRERRPRLVRSRRGRLIGGVCSGLGAHFDVDPILFRIAFVGLAIFSGVGIALYLAILLLVPEEGASRAPICVLWRGPVGEQWHASADRRLLRWLLVAATVVVCAALLALAGAWLAGTHAQLAAWAVVAVGATLVLSAFTRAIRWFVLPGVAFALAVATIAAAHVDLRGGVGDHFYRPQNLSEVRRGYQLGAGRLEIDLRNLALQERRLRNQLKEDTTQLRRLQEERREEEEQEAAETKPPAVQNGFEFSTSPVSSVPAPTKPAQPAEIQQEMEAAA